jgi:hypothetical protein
MSESAAFNFESTLFHNVERATAEERLWRAVIASTLQEWVRGPLRYSRIAEQFLFNDNEDFQAVCSSAGMNPDNLRRRLQSIRARGIQKENTHPPAASPATSHRRILKSLSPVLLGNGDF